jgi:hypothetical protein
MPRSRIDTLAGTWTEAITAVSKRPAEDVTAFLERHGLRPQSLIPRPVDITIRSLRFSGVKALPEGPQDFEFTWDGLGPGLWLIGSDENSRGKTSLLGVMRWLLRGSPPSQIPPGVLKWIHRAGMEFDVGGVPHRVSVDLRGGFAAELAEQRDGGPPTPLLAAGSAAEFEHGMSDFMMSRLGLDPIVGMRDGEVVVHHRWAALFSAFHIGTDYAALLGDTVHDALVNRMLNMFCGFRHAPAVARIQNVVASFGAEREREDQAARAVAEHARSKLERLQSELAALPATAPDTPSSAELLSAVRSTSDDLAAAYTRVTDLRRLRGEAQEVAASARAEMNADKSALLDFKEARAAERVFRRLTPTCCPRCDQALGEERKERETSARACMVCGGDAPTEDSAGAEEALAALEENVRLSEAAHAEARAERDRVHGEVLRAEEEVRTLEALLRSRRERHAEGSRLDAEAPRRALLQAMVAEAERDVGSAVARQEAPDAALARACERVFRERLKDEQDEVLREVERETFSLLRAFGVANLVGVKLNGVPHLHLVKDLVRDEPPVPFGKSSIGDQLRAKIAIVVALMKVAHRRGVGRHPGILFIDTPGAQEMTTADLEQMAQGLAALRDELPTLQIFVATTRVEEFEAAVPADFRLVASGGAMVW